MTRLGRGAFATLANALNQLAPQLVALFTLSAGDFGRFSLVYLLYALGASILLSVVCEAAVRRYRRDGHKAQLIDYLGAAGWVGLMLGLATAVVGRGVFGDVRLAMVGGVAVGCAVYRVGARFREVESGAWNRAILADSTGLVILAVAVVVLRVADVELGALDVLLYAWAVAAIAATGVGLLRPPLGPTVLVRWVRDFRHDISPLLRESLVMDLSSIGAPFAISPILGAMSFGIYRAVSNVAAPVRLILNPVRPRIAAMSLRSLTSWRLSVGVVGGGTVLGVVAAATLWLVGDKGIDLGVLRDLAPYAVPTGLFVVLNFIGHFYYLLARTHARPEQLWRGRLIQSGAAFVLPVLGAWLGGLSVGIWSYVVATALGSATWLIVAVALKSRLEP